MRRRAFAITCILVLGGYLYTIAPDLTLQDSGELAVADDHRGVLRAEEAGARL